MERAMSRHKVKQYLLLLTVVSLSFAVFINSLSNEFVWDDKFEILNNDWIRDASHIPDILFSQSLGWLKPAQSSTKYSPLKLLVRLIQFQIAGTDPWIYQFTNVLVHAMSAVMVFYITSGIFISFFERKSLVFPFAASVLFAVHPIHTEPVNWAIGLSELSMSFFCLLSFYLHMKAYEDSDKKNVLAGLFFFIALLFKITAVFFVPVFIAYDYAMKKRCLVHLKQGAISAENDFGRIFSTCTCSGRIFNTIFFCHFRGKRPSKNEPYQT